MEQISSSGLSSFLQKIKPLALKPVKCPKCGEEWFKLTDEGMCIDCLNGRTVKVSKEQEVKDRAKSYVFGFDYVMPSTADYVIKDTPQDKLLHFIKHLHGMRLNDRRWNEKHYSRSLKRCKEIMSHFEHEDCQIKLTPYRVALKAVDDIVKELVVNQLPWTVETVIKRLDDWERQVVRYGKYIKHQYGVNQ